MTRLPPPLRKRRAASIFGPMLPGREVTGVKVALHVGGVTRESCLFVWRAEVDQHLRHGGEHDHGVDAEDVGHVGGGEILVDHRFDAEAGAVGVADDRDAAAAAGDDDGAAARQRVPR